MEISDIKPLVAFFSRLIGRFQRRFSAFAVRFVGSLIRLKVSTRDVLEFKQRCLETEAVQNGCYKASRFGHRVQFIRHNFDFVLLGLCQLFEAKTIWNANAFGFGARGLGL